MLLLMHNSKQNLRGWGNEKLSILVLSTLSNNVSYIYLCFFEKTLLYVCQMLEEAEAATKRRT